MKQNKDNLYRIDTDKAWNNLRERLENDHLLTADVSEYSLKKTRNVFFYRAAAVAAICIGIIFADFYFSQKKNRSQIVTQNTENSGTLVTTLEDGSTVYLASKASVSRPTAFAKDQRKVELNGNALFCVTKDENRPFVVTTNGITIEVLGTVFAVQSSIDHSFELFVKQGKVNVHSKEDRIGIPVEAGETIRLSKSGLSKSKMTNSLPFSSFTDKMCFKDEKLNHIIQAINAIHGSPTIISEESINNRTLTVTFENNSVETMAKLICLALNLEPIHKQDTIFIRPVLK